MRKLCLALLLAGGCSEAFARPPTPAPPPGEWVRSDYRASKDADAEARAGSAIYLLVDGRAMVWCPEAGVPCLATYQENKRILRLKEVQVDPGPFTPTVARYVYDPKAKTLKLLGSGSSKEAAFLKLETYRWRRARVPASVSQALVQR